MFSIPHVLKYTSPIYAALSYAWGKYNCQLIDSFANTGFNVWEFSRIPRCDYVSSVLNAHPLVGVLNDMGKGNIKCDVHCHLKGCSDEEPTNLERSEKNPLIFDRLL